jgi:hypothetical protein
MISIKIDSKTCCWSDSNNSPNWDDLWKFEDYQYQEDILAECIFSENGIHQVRYGELIFWVMNDLNIE